MWHLVNTLSPSRQSPSRRRLSQTPSVNTPSFTASSAGASPTGALLLATLGYQLAIRRKSSFANMDTETSINKPSGLPRLGSSTTSRLPQLHSSSAMSHHGLHEITESQTNTRSQSAMAPPSLTGIKRGLQPPVSQSEPKRKTLAEKAATEFPQATTKSGLVAPTPVRSTIKGTSLRDMQSTRPVTRSVASYNSNTSRNTSTSSYASSIGPGARPPSRTAHARSASVRSTATRSNRSATSMGVRAEEPTKNAWDVDERLGTFESEVKAMKEMISNSINGRMSSESELAAEKQKVAELEQTRNALESTKLELQSKLEDANNKIYSLTRELDDEKRARRNDAEDLEREHRNDIDNRLRQFNREKDELDRVSHQKMEKLKEELAADFAKQLGEAHQAFEELEKLLEEEKRSAVLRSQANGKDLEAQFVQIAQMKKEKEELVEAQRELKGLVAIREARIADLEKAVTSGQAALIHLKSDEQKQVEHFRIIREEKQVAVEQAAKAEQQAEEYKTKLRVEERRRRKLFDQLQTLKGNIRVMCRIRPGRDDSGNAQIQTDVGEYDDHIGKMTLMVPIKKYDGEQLVDRSYDFERVFEQQEGNKVVFEEISQLVQSALDGQKVCVFAYGQTGSGKTFTMSAQQDSIIPSAMKMIYEQAESMKDAGWTYEMWGSFTEVYNEKLFDLLSDDGSRNEVQLRQDPTTKKYYVESRASKLGSPAEVETMLATANKNRTVAATNMNRASSRSHCVFTLKLEGVDIDGNRSEGVLNLIDLAGSERVKESQVEGQNFKEAASINTSLSTLSKVMTALAENASHIPYRDSSLTKLLEGCLGGNAKALMFVMVSPLAVDIKETVSSLDFATTVSKAKPGQQGGPLKAIKTGRSIKKR